MEKCLAPSLEVELQQKLTNFKEYAVSHSHLEQVDKVLMRAIAEPAGFAHVLVYGPSGVGKTTMLRQIAKRLNGLDFTKKLSSPQYHNSHFTQLPLLVVETRPSDGVAFNRADYYRTALKFLGEPFYERRTLVNIDTEQVWEKKGRSRTKAAQFDDSPELRNALEEAMTRRGVRAVLLDEAQHLMKVGSTQSAANLLEQLNWIKSMTNVTGVIHILIGTYELLDFQNLNGQTSRRSLDIHFPRYLFQYEQDRQNFQGALLALLKQVPLHLEIESLMQRWIYFYERSIGCIGVLKDWLIRAVAAALYDGSDTLTWELCCEHALTLAQCERMAIDAIEGEQKLKYVESRREHLWQLLQIGMENVNIPSGASSPTTATEPPPKATRKKRASKTNAQIVSATMTTETEPVAPNKKRTRKKPEAVPSCVVETSTQPSTLTGEVVEEKTSMGTAEPPSPQKKSSRRVGQRKPKRDPVG